MNTNIDNDNDDDDGPGWKRWHFLAAAPLLAALAVWQITDGSIGRGISGFVLAALCLLLAAGMKPKRQ